MTNESVRCQEIIYHDLDESAFDSIQAEGVSLADERGGLKIETYNEGSRYKGALSHKGVVYALPEGVTFCMLANSDPRVYQGRYVKFTIASTLSNITQVKSDLEARLEGIPKSRETLFV